MVIGSLTIGLTYCIVYVMSWTDKVTDVALLRTSLGGQLEEFLTLKVTLGGDSYALTTVYHEGVAEELDFANACCAGMDSSCECNEPKNRALHEAAVERFGPLFENSYDNILVLAEVSRWCQELSGRVSSKVSPIHVEWHTFKVDQLYDWVLGCRVHCELESTSGVSGEWSASAKGSRLTLFCKCGASFDSSRDRYVWGRDIYSCHGDWSWVNPLIGSLKERFALNSLSEIPLSR